MSEAVVVHFLYVVPIPVGREVELRVYLRDTAVFGKKLEPQFDAPLVVDLETGIVYGVDWHFDESGSYETNTAQKNLPLTVRTDLEEVGRWRGRVAATRIAQLGHDHTQTSLTITPAEGARPYR